MRKQFCKHFSLFIFSTLLLLTACKKDAGTGGLATITGKVYAYDLNKLGDKVDSGYRGDVKVYISYGNHTWVDDDTRTSYDGSYAFSWLQKGDYKVWVLTQCDSCPLAEQADIENISITKRRETVNVRTLIYSY